MAGDGSVFDSFPWWDSRDVLTQITPSRFAYIKSAAGDLVGRRVLDLGCGGGLLSEPLARSGSSVEAIDISTPSLALARRHAQQSCLQINYLAGRAEELPYKDGTFDAAVAFDVLEHVSSLEETVAEISRVLHPGGKLIYDTMNQTFVCRLVAIWIGENLWRGGPPKGTHDWRKFIRPKRLLDVLGGNGIVNVETRGFVPVPDMRGRLRMRFSRFKGISYVGYGVKQ